MSKTNFTPGEWKFKENNFFPSEYLSASKGWIDVDNKSICTIFNENDGHLLAAAKEMYELLEKIEPAIKYQIDDIGNGYADVTIFAEDYDKIKKALAKARGEKIEQQ